MSDVIDVGAAVLPLPLDLFQGIPAPLDHAAVVLDLEPPVFRDVAKCAAIAFMPRPPPVTFTITWGARRTVASMRRRMNAALLLKGPRRGVLDLTMRFPG